MRPIVAIGVAVVAFVLGIAAGGSLLAGGGSRARSAPAELEAEAVRLTEEVARLTTALAAERSARRASEREEEAPAAGPEGTGEAPPDAAAPGEGEEGRAGPAFFAGEFSGVLEKIDWKKVGNNMFQMSGLIRELLPSLVNRERPEPRLIGRIQELNGPLLMAALTVQEGLPGQGVNGKFTDPAFMINAMASALAAADLPLTAEQAKALERTARTWRDADSRRRSGYDDETYELQKIYEEAELKAGFFDDAFALMTPEQVAVLTTEGTKDRVRLDVFSEALIYSPLARPLPFSTTAGLAEEYVRGSISEFRLPEERHERVREIVTAWLDEVPRELIDRETSNLDLQGLLEVDRVNAWARQTRALLVRLVQDLPLDEENRARARGQAVVFVPIKRPPEGE